MTIGEMTRQLAQVRAYYHEQGELEQQHVDRNLLASRIDKLRLNRCRVASSNIHGNGLFATRAIEEGERSSSGWAASARRPACPMRPA